MGERVLVIEDNHENLALMTYLLSAGGYAPISAMTGQSGLEAARRERPVCIFCDILLPDMDGYAVVRALKNDPDLRRIPVVAVTALAMLGDREKTLRAGFDEYLAKPIEPESFLAGLSRIVRLGTGLDS